MPNGPRIALILSGGGARAAYQAGVARAISEFVPEGSPNPFKIICGTSAGAINAASLAAGARDFRLAATTLCGLWSKLSVGDIYRARSSRRCSGRDARGPPGIGAALVR
jgi:NTE family protein